MPSTPWSEAIERLLSEKKWSQRELARRAKLQPNTLTNILKHGKPTDTETLSKIAKAFDVELVELFATLAQATLLRTYGEGSVPLAAASFFRELEGTVRDLVSRELARAPKKDVQRMVEAVVRGAEKGRRWGKRRTSAPKKPA